MGGGAQVGQVAIGAVSEADRHNIRGEHISVDTIPLVGEQTLADAVRAVARLPRVKALVLAGSLMGGDIEQAVREVVKALNRLCFAPAPPTRREDTVAVDIHHCPFNVDPHDPGGAIVCGFHEGLVRGLAEVASGQDVGVRLLPFVAPGLCRIELSFAKAPASRGKGKPAPGDGGHPGSNPAASLPGISTGSASSSSAPSIAIT